MAIESEVPCGKNIDPRIVRTRLLLQQALEKLLAAQSFEELSVGDIAEAATVNRATFYAHYPDKFALLRCTVAARFSRLLESRGATFRSGCANALRSIITGVCDFLAETTGPGPRHLEPQVETAIIGVVRQMLLRGLQENPAPGPIPLELLAGTASGAIYGGAKEWVSAPDRTPVEGITETIFQLATPILYPESAPLYPADA